MNSNNFVLKGQICHSISSTEMELVEDGYLVCREGVSAGVFRELPEEFKYLKLVDYGNRLLIPGLVDLHIHAPQYGFRGMGMDMELLDWLEQVTFPEEARYADEAYAKAGYRIFAEDMKRSATTRACIFATIHTDATVHLMELLEDTGLKTMVGKVNMDRNSPDILREKDADTSIRDTVGWLERISGRFQNVKPILTPRFIPCCTDELMKGLKVIQEQYDLPVHSHLSENRSEVEWVKELCPGAKSYGDAYEQFGMFGGGSKTIMAHCVYLTDQELVRMQENGVFIAHCPQSNTNLASGIAPVRQFLDTGIKTGLGSDVGGGHMANIFRAMADAIQVSKLYWRLVDDTKKPLTVEEAFYLGTKGGGAFFGKAGSFEAGYELDVLVLDDQPLHSPKQLTLAERLERIIYLADERYISAKYVAGNQIF
ncbi:MAG: amidohydrolase family protein [Lachnospiraceae bacterium]